MKINEIEFNGVVYRATYIKDADCNICEHCDLQSYCDIAAEDNMLFEFCQKKILLNGVLKK